MTARPVAHFVVTHPLGMHARVCSRWIKILQRLCPIDLEYAEEWAWIVYKDSTIPADSLFRLLETRIPYGAEFDLLLDERCVFESSVEEQLAFVISQAAFEPQNS